MSDEKEIYRVPADGHGALLVEAADAAEAFETAREQGTVREANMSLSIGESYRERVRVVEDPKRTPINVEEDTGPGVHIPEFPSVGRLRAARKDLGLTQAAVADAMGVSPKTVSHYEQGTREISLSKAQEYADVLREAFYVE